MSTLHRFVKIILSYHINIKLLVRRPIVTSQLNRMTEYAVKKSESASPKCMWNKFSESRLAQLEQQILKVLKRAYQGWFVNIGTVVGSEENKIWTIALNTKSRNTPLVCLHGFGAAVGFWCLNLDSLATKRPVYAIDLLGFGRSSRPKFSNDALEAEQQMVDAIEEWRKKMNLEQFILMGHSFGGYLATSYTISYPDRVKHLILADPWGFGEKKTNQNPPFWIRTLIFILYPFTNFNPLATLRAAGPFGPWVVSKTRADISSKYDVALNDKDLIANYIYQCNSQKPTGETAFHNMMKGFGWAKNPMVHRTPKIKEGTPVTILYGAHTWMDQSIGKQVAEQRPNSYVKVEIVPNAGHHIHADQPQLFNNMVIEACDKFEENIDESIEEEVLGYGDNETRVNQKEADSIIDSIKVEAQEPFLEQEQQPPNETSIIP